MTKVKKRRTGTKILLFFFAVIFLLLFIAYSSNTHIYNSSYKITSPKIPSAFDGYKIVQISDLHSSRFGENNQRLIKKIDKQNPNIVVMTGDMVNGYDEIDDFDVFLNFAKELSRFHKVYYIIGNHEMNLGMESEKYTTLISKLESFGINVLDNGKTVLKKDGQSINMYGMWFNGRYYNDMSDSSAKKYFFDTEDMNKILGSSDNDMYNIVLTHNPIYFDTYAEWGSDLTLTGHMHGGVIRIPFKGGLISPERVYWPGYDAGQFTKRDSKMIVNRGLGNGVTGYRFFNWPDISTITLKSNNPK